MRDISSAARPSNFTEASSDPWLCVAGLLRLCPCRRLLVRKTLLCSVPDETEEPTPFLLPKTSISSRRCALIVCPAGGGECPCNCAASLRDPAVPTIRTRGFASPDYSDFALIEENFYLFFSRLNHCPTLFAPGVPILPTEKNKPLFSRTRHHVRGRVQGFACSGI